MRAPRLCTCGRVVPHGVRCQCKAGSSAPDLRPSARKRGYDGEWEAMRARVLAEQPICETVGCGARSSHADHIQPVRFRPELRLVRSNLRALCQSCHNARSARQRAQWRRDEG